MTPRSLAQPTKFGSIRIAATLLIFLSGIFPRSGAAQILENYDYEDLEFRGIGVEAGRIWPGRVESTTSYGLRLDLGMIGPRVRIVPMARFWASSLLRSEVDGLAEQIILVCERQGDVSCPERLDLGEVKLSDLEMSADAHFLFFPERRLSPYVGLNLGLHLLNGRGDFIDGTFVEDLLDTVAPGLGTMFGFTVQIGSAFMIGAEARGMVGSDVRYGALSATASWLLPAPGVDETLGIRRIFSR